MNKPRLGKGLQALISEMSPAEDNTEIRELSLGLITPNPFQPRRVFDEASLKELADSIKDHGVIQAITLRPRGSGY